MTDDELKKARLRTNILGVVAIVVCVGFLYLGMLALARAHSDMYWSCSPDQRGMQRNSDIVSICDGKEWVPVRVPVPPK